MPQPSRKDMTSAQRALEKESKRARGALSCAECRRLKLKCDKTIPCSSCKRRGCSAICPNGSLITGQGTRFVLADTEKLHKKIAQMSDRIRQLEDALAILHSTQASDGPHPLLSRELMEIKSSIELHSAVDGLQKYQNDQEDLEESQYIDAFGTLAIHDDGAATFYGRSAGTESLLIGERPVPSPAQSTDNSPAAQDSSPDLPPAISHLVNAFPFVPSFPHSEIDLDYLIATYLPPWDEAWRLSQLYLEQAPWFFGAVTRRQLVEETLPLWYEEAPRPPPVPDYSMEDKMSATTVQHTKTAHELALLFMVFCFGAVTDMELSPAPENAEAEQFYLLTKAALTLEPIFDRPPSVSMVQALCLMAIYEGMCSRENSIETTWALFGLATKLAQSVGLHRDCARWKLSPAEVQKRRALFWELFVTDCWQSLATGRLATFSLPFVDCELPSDPDQTIADDGTTVPSFPYWKARFGAECLADVVQGTLTSRAPRYSIILELDRKVRDLELPLYAKGLPPEGAGLAQAMSHFMPVNYRELTLLYIHRCFFAHAISSHPLDPIKSQYAPSFLAGYRSACTIIASIKQQFSLFPSQISRFWVLWTHAFSATVMLSSVATHCSRSSIAPAALLELNNACDLFERAAVHGGRSVKFLPILQRLRAKAHNTIMDTNRRIPPSVLGTIFQPTQKDENQDEFSIFSGKTHTVTAKSSVSPSMRSNQILGHSPAPSPESTRASSDPPQHMDIPSFEGAHPSLVNELNGFVGRINAQIQSAYAYGDSDQIMDDSVMPQKSSGVPAPYGNPSQGEYSQSPYRQHSKQGQQTPSEQKPVGQEIEAQLSQSLGARRQENSQRELSDESYLLQQIDVDNHRQLQRSTPLYYNTEYNMPVTPVTSSNTIYSVPSSGALNRVTPQQDISDPRTRANQEYQRRQTHLDAQRMSGQSRTYDNVASTYTQHTVADHSPMAAHYAALSSSYDPRAQSEQSQVPLQSTQDYHYWPTASAFTVPQTQHHLLQTQDQTPGYAPEMALRDVNADDHSLQETWQAYMYKVASPRLLLDDSL
ncbi:hypothetical protein AX17_001621 [Amanita inopinata Kibby_2008]|nr:hypothetical protein AX17_001621 [Amanita inopinata Kibby_2008]